VCQGNIAIYNVVNLSIHSIFLFFIHIFLFIRSSYMGPQPKGCRTCQDSCNINKANICTVHKKKTIKKIYIVKYNTYLVLG